MEVYMDNKVIKVNRSNSTAIEFNSANDIINVKIKESNGPELILEDDSIIVFSDSSIYFNMITDGIIHDNVICLSALNLRFTQEHDDTPEIYYENREIIEVTKYKSGNNGFIYRLFAQQH